MTISKHYRTKVKSGKPIHMDIEEVLISIKSGEGDSILAKYYSIPEPLREDVQEAFDNLRLMYIRDMGEKSSAELVVKLYSYLWKNWKKI